MTVWAFSLAGEPRGKARPRATVRGGFARVYSDPTTRKYEQSIREVAERMMCGKMPLEGALSVSLRFRLSVPASYSKRLRTAILAGEEPYFGSFDADNLAKAILDALNGVLFVDDKQVVRLFVEKLGAEQPGVDIRVEALT